MKPHGVRAVRRRPQPSPLVGFETSSVRIEREVHNIRNVPDYLKTELFGSARRLATIGSS
jgi:hypothetical protein